MHPVHADYVGNGEFESTGIAFEDYKRMSMQQHKLGAGRKNAPPAWAFNDSQLRAVIVGCVEARAYMIANTFGTADCTGTHAERLARAQQFLSAKRANFEARIDNLCKQYVAAKNAGNLAQARDIAQKVEELDTSLRMIDNPAKFYVGVAYHYWRSGLNSVETAQQLGIKPPHVRALLWRMGRTAGELGYGPVKSINKGVRGRAAARKALADTQSLLEVAKAIIEKNRRQQIAAKLAGRARPEAVRQKISNSRMGQAIPPAVRQKLSKSCIAAAAQHGTNLIPYGERLPLLVKMFHAGATRTQMAAALGWHKSANGQQNGYGMVKRLLKQAHLI